MRLFSARYFLSFCVFILLNLSCTKEFQKDSSSIFQLNNLSNGSAQAENASAGARLIKDAYIVVFKDDVADVDLLTETLSKQIGLKAKFTFKHTIKGFAATIPAQVLEGITNNPNVKYIEQDQEVRLEATQTEATWGIDRLDQKALPLDGSYTYNTEGASVDAYIFDTGILTSHSEFSGGRAIFGYDAFGGNGLDSNGHGTHVAGTVGGATYGVAKKVNLYAVRILGNSGSGSWSGVIAGIDWAVGHHTTRPAVGNMSIGGGLLTSLNDAVRRAIADGIVMCVAAGNYNADASNYSPASTAEAITVGATTSTDSRSSFSNYGSVVDIFAPGSSITSSWCTGTTAINTVSGTSMATPHVAGTAALYLEAFPGSTPAQVQQGLKDNAASGIITGLPTGTANLLLQNQFLVPPLPLDPKPTAPTLSAPANLAINVSTSPSFSWSAVSNASSYRLEWSTSSNFSTISNQSTTGTSVSVVGLAQATVYYWRVAAINSFGETVSLIRSFTTLLSAPSLISPSNTASNVSRTPALNWTAVTGATGYDIQLSTSSNFTSGVFNFTSNTNSITISTVLNAKTTYYWRVRAVKTGIATSAWSGSRRFSTSN
jgi:subtilisin family serine protease